ncbi:MAG: hypothetical protein K2Z25_04120 [Beijerinckiaceae bacterium]|uniref:hypothetical protein n=1 Tax=Bosea sp. (in: a-proteobacteria) TaxID=1871050 RepID=UPI0012E3BF98|nr:hypothetical protein [Bosea sp. (in: a-proteobacteria)]MBX9907878.1 hypothetical protein [Beijerinckiaceae bacterium]
MLDADRLGYSLAMISKGTSGASGRGLLAAACGLVLMFQLMVSALAGSSHLAVKFDAGEIGLVEICGATPDSERDRTTHIEGVNACCVWAKSVALAPVTPPLSASLIPRRAEAAKTIFLPRVEASASSSPQGLPQATGPPRRS